MVGYIDYIKYFKNKDANTIVDRLKKYYPKAEQSQIDSWYELIQVIKNSNKLDLLCDDVIIGIEYSLPIDSMAVDLFLYGINKNNEETMYILESKQWGDEFIQNTKFENYRSEGSELYPQTQIYRHLIGIKNYLEIGEKLKNINPFVFIENATSFGLGLVKSNKDLFVNSIPITNNISDFFDRIIDDNIKPGSITITDFYNSRYFPSKSIIEAMNSIVTKEEPFVLTKSQEEKMIEIIKNVNAGKKIIHISGSAGSGKTALLLNLYVKLLKKRDSTGFMPYFASGGQNTWLYRSLYPSVANMFSWTFSMQKNVNSYNASKTILLIDEAQSNQNGLILDLVNKGAIVIFCYDDHQIVNLNNSVSEMPELKKRADYIHIKLEESVRFNGSQLFESNIMNYLWNNKTPIDDEKYMFKVVHSMDDLKKEVLSLIRNNPNSTVSLSGLLCNNAQEVVDKSEGFFFINWGNKKEVSWMPYIQRKNYTNDFNGKIWLGTWWLPGLDVDYNVVVVGADAIMTNNGLIGNASQSKLYQMIQSILDNLNVPQQDRRMGVCSNLNSFINYTNQPNSKKYMDEFQKTFNELIRNYYYIMLTRGRKGCIVYFTEERP